MIDQPDRKSSVDSAELIPPHGGYRDLKSYQMSEIVHDGTVVFCDRFVERRSQRRDWKRKP